MENDLRYKRLKNVLKREIYSYLSFEDFCLLYGLDKSYMTFLTEKNCSYLKSLILLFLVKDFHNLKVSLDFIKNLGMKICNMNEILISKFNNHQTLIPMIGYKCDGGIYSKFYHYLNLFTLNKLNFFCSKSKSSNFNVFSALISEFYSYRNCNLSKIGYNPSILKIKDIKSLNNVDNNKEISLINQNIFLSKTTDIFNTDIFSLYKSFSENLLDDSHILNKFCSTDYFCLETIYFMNSGPYTCPGKTLLVFIHENLDLDESDNKLLSETKELKTENDLLNYVDKNDNLKCLYSSQCSTNIKSYEFNTFIQRERNRNLKLLIWVQITPNNQVMIKLKGFAHYGKYAIIKFVDATNAYSYDSNIDFSKTLFFGNVLKISNN